MTRTSQDEFTAKTKDSAAIRANGKCEICGLPVKGRGHFDHILPVALGGKPTLENCQFVCEPCHTAKTSKEDLPRIRKADRQRRSDNGADRPHGSMPKPPSENDRRRSEPVSKIASGPTNIARRFQ